MPNTPFESPNHDVSAESMQADAVDERCEEQEVRPSLAELLTSATFAPERHLGPQAIGMSLLGVCIDDTHPTLLGRVRVRWVLNEHGHEAWIPTLYNLPVRRGDHVLLSQPLNGPEPIVVGVIDGFAHRANLQRQTAANLELKHDEVLRIHDARARPLLELRSDERGPVVQLLAQNLTVEVEGKLAFRAEEIRLEAQQGNVEIAATDDVRVRGEVIHLN